jgi:hypothetical protein
MPDPLTWYAAIVGSGATFVAGRREILQRRIRVRVDHGWRYFQTDESPPQFDNLMVYVMVTNTGGRNVVVQHVGWEFLVDSGEQGLGGGRILIACRVEVPLEEPKVVEPDGVPLKVEAWVGPLAWLFDPIDVDVRPVAFTGGGNARWEGPSGPLAQRIPVFYDLEKMRQRIEELKAEGKPPKQMGSPDLFYVEPVWVESHERATRPTEVVNTEPPPKRQGEPTPPGV